MLILLAEKNVLSSSILFRFGVYNVTLQTKLFLFAMTWLSRDFPGVSEWTSWKSDSCLNPTTRARLYDVHIEIVRNCTSQEGLNKIKNNRYRIFIHSSSDRESGCIDTRARAALLPELADNRDTWYDVSWQTQGRVWATLLQLCILRESQAPLISKSMHTRRWFFTFCFYKTRFFISLNLV